MYIFIKYIYICTGYYLYVLFLHTGAPKEPHPLTSLEKRPIPQRTLFSKKSYPPTNLT